MKITGESIHLSQCKEDEFIAIVSKVAGRSVDGRDIPYRSIKNVLTPLRGYIGDASVETARI